DCDVLLQRMSTKTCNVPLQYKGYAFSSFMGHKLGHITIFKKLKTFKNKEIMACPWVQASYGDAAFYHWLRQNNLVLPDDSLRYAHWRPIIEKTAGSMILPTIVKHADLSTVAQLL